jgi:hypothetical protein
MSIGFETLQSTMDGDVRQLKELKLWEISVVTFPMNESATISSVKSLSVSDDEVQHHLRAIRRLWAPLLEVLRHRDCGVLELDLRVEERSPIARSGEVRCPGDRILKNQNWREPPCLKVVIHEGWATFGIGVYKIKAALSDGKVAPVSEVQRIRDEIFLTSSDRDLPDASAIEFGVVERLCVVRLKGSKAAVLGYLCLFSS